MENAKRIKPEFPRWKIKRAQKDFAYFNEQFRYPPPQFPKAQMHKDWEKLLQNAYGKYHKILLLAGRGSAKSERVTINYPLWLLGENNDLRITIVSTPQDKAESFLSKQTQRIEYDDFYRECFGNLKPSSPSLWRTNAITIKRSIYSKDPSICAVGTMGQAVSKRADVIIVDDPLNDENTKTDYQRKEMIKWHDESLDPILEPHGIEIAIMTPWHEEDLSQYLMKQPGWVVLEYPAIINPEENFERWLETDDPQLTSWPEKYGYKLNVTDHQGNFTLDEDGQPKTESFLRSKYNRNVDAFMSQYLLRPFSITGTLFREDWMKWFKPPDFQLVLPWCLLYQGWDLSIKVNERADYTACATVAFNHQDNSILILDIWRAKLTPLDQFKAVQEEFKRWNPVCPVQQVTIESDQYQEALAMGLIVATTLPIVESPSRGKRKLDRIGLLGPHFMNGRIRTAEHLQNGEFTAEYKRFPRGAKDDMLDALTKAVEPILGQTASGIFSIGEVEIVDPRRYIQHPFMGRRVI